MKVLPTRTQSLLTHLGTLVIGVVLGVTISYWAAAKIRLFLSMATSVQANDAYMAGKFDEAIFLLGQAAIEDPKLYTPWILLGSIYRTEGEVRLALNAYEKALKIFDENEDAFPFSARQRTAERARIRAQIDSLQK